MGNVPQFRSSNVLQSRSNFVKLSMSSNVILSMMKFVMLLNLHMEMVDLVLEATLLDLDVEVPTLEVLLVELCLTMVLLLPQLAVKSPVKNVPMCQDKNARMSQDRCPDKNVPMSPDKSAELCLDNSAT